jgi:hypothetical protein
MRITLHVFIYILFSIGSLYAQLFTVKGIVKDSIDNSPLQQASVVLKDLLTGDDNNVVLSEKNGSFLLNDVTKGIYLLEISFIGYEKFSDTLRIFRQNIDLGIISLKKSFIQMQQVEIVDKIIPVEQKEDTLLFTAKGFRTNKDANAEELITKIPGVQKEEGKLKTQGEEIKQVLVDGKQFFGDDPMIALRNLPAEMIDKIQIYDRGSEQSQFTGFDDGQTSKTINIITREDRRRGQFGKVYAGYGTEDRFLSGGSLNYFEGDRRVSLIGIMNNVNQQNFSMQDLLGLSGSQRSGRFGGQMLMGGRRGGGSYGGEMNNFRVDAQSGNTNTYSLGVNYMDLWGKDVTINGSYFFNHQKNASDETLNREYFSNPLLTQYYNEKSIESSKNYNHRFNMKLEWNIDTSNSLMFQPRFSFQDNSSMDKYYGINYYPGNNTINSSDNNTTNERNGFNFSNELLYRHKFVLQGRTFSIGINNSLNNRKTDRTINSISSYSRNIITIDTIDQVSNQLVNGFSIAPNIAYTEPIGTDAQLMINFNLNFNKNSSDKDAFNLNPISKLHDLSDSLQTNKYENDFFTVRGGLSYRYRTETTNLNIGISYQQSNLRGSQTFPYSYNVDRTFYNFLPNARLTFRFGWTSNLRINYNTSVDAPSINQLQNTIDNSNPLFLKTGNQNLNEEYNHRFSVQYMTTNFESGSTFFAMAFANYNKNYIGNYTINANSDTLLPGSIFLKKGTQLTYPINYDKSFSLRSFVNGGFPISAIQCNLNIYLGFSFSRIPGQINKQQSISKTYSLNEGIVLASNISEKIDFRISYTPTYNITKNDVQNDLSDEYLIHNGFANIFLTLYEGFFIKSDFTYYNNPGLGSGLKQKYYLLNAGIGTKLFSNDVGEIKFEVFDLLNQNESLNKTITETYIEEKTNKILQRYYLLSFTYNLRMFTE